MIVATGEDRGWVIFMTLFLTLITLATLAVYALLVRFTRPKRVVVGRDLGELQRVFEIALLAQAALQLARRRLRHRAGDDEHHVARRHTSDFEHPLVDGLAQASTSSARVSATTTTDSLPL